MASLSSSDISFDLFSEIDGVCESKMDSEFCFKSVHDINTDVGLPSTGISLFNDVVSLDYNNCLIDFTNPLLNGHHNNNNPINFNNNDDDLVNDNYDIAVNANDIMMNNDDEIIYSSKAIPNETIIPVSFPAAEENNLSSASPSPATDSALAQSPLYNNPCAPTVTDNLDIPEERDSTTMVAPLNLPKIFKSYVAIPKCDQVSDVHIAELLPPVVKSTNITTVSVAAAIAEDNSVNNNVDESNQPKSNNDANTQSTENNPEDNTSLSNSKSTIVVKLPVKQTNNSSKIQKKCNRKQKQVKEKTTDLVEKAAIETLSSQSNVSKSTRKRKSESVDKNLPFYSKKPCTKQSIRAAKASLDNSVKFKAYELEKLKDPDLERCRRNAINAKKNRDLKKQRMEELEQSFAKVKEERDQLAGMNGNLEKEKVDLLSEVAYLKNIIKNQSEISNALQKINTSEIRFNTPSVEHVSSSSARS